MVRRVLSVIFISSFFVAILNAQAPMQPPPPPSYGCDSSWVLYPNTNIYGGIQQINVTTESGCKTACYMNSTCQGCDFNPNNGVGSQCYLLFATGPKQAFNGVNHWDYNRTAPCAGSCGSWKSYPNTGVYGGTEQPNITTEDDCRNYCAKIIGSNCTGIDWNSGNPMGHQCYTQYGMGTKYTANGVTHWDYNSTSGCTTPCGKWTSVPNSGVYGGTLRPDAKSEDSCKMYCSGNATCTGVDWNANNMQCFMQFGNGLTYSGSGITHWDFNRTGPCPVDCIFAFSVSPNTGAYGGVEQSMIFNDTECKKACIRNNSCVGCDWNSNNGPGHQCFLLFNYGVKYSANGVYHYDFNRASCNGSNNQMSTVAGGGGCYWQETDNTNIYGGTQDGSNTLWDCQSTCMSTSGCKSVDFAANNPAGSRCYLLQTQNGKMAANWGVNHYDYICTAALSTTTQATINMQCWSLMSNTNAYGGSQVPSVNTAVQCQTYCLNQRCPSFDFDRNQNVCYTFSSPVSSTNPSVGVDHYTYIC